MQLAVGRRTANSQLPTANDHALSWRLACVAPGQDIRIKPTVVGAAAASGAHRGTRDVLFEGMGTLQCAVYDRYALAPGTKFDGPAGLRDVLLTKRDLFVETFAERLLTYALGRGVEEYDRPIIRKITREAAADNQRWSAIILGIVKSTPFQMRSVSDGNP